MAISIPRPGSPVRGSKSGKAIMALFDLLGRNWALGIIWQVSDAALTFRQLQDRCESVSPTVLNKRLKELREAQLLIHDGTGYTLTPLGRELFAILEPFGDYADKWSSELPDTTSS